MPVVILTILTVIFAIVMAKTKFGRHVYAIGGNELASKLSGVKTDKTKILVYTLSGILSSIAGIVLFARLTSAEAAAGLGIEMDVIAGTVIGGASMAGGAGSVVGAIIGSALIGVITNGVVLLNINTYAQQAITGVVILIAVSLDSLRKKN
jgi:ribose transport system permease protein